MKNLLNRILGAGILIGLTNCNIHYLKIKNPKRENCFNKAHKIKYIEDKKDYWQIPEETEKERTGDCEDKAFYLHSCLKGQGIKSEVIFGYVDLHHKTEKQGHAWVEYKKWGTTYILDPTIGEIKKRRRVGKDKFIQVNNNQYVKKKLKEFEKRSGLKNINSHY